MIHKQPKHKNKCHICTLKRFLYSFIGCVSLLLAIANFMIAVSHFQDEKNDHHTNNKNSSKKSININQRSHTSDTNRRTHNNNNNNHNQNESKKVSGLVANEGNWKEKQVKKDAPFANRKLEFLHIPKNAGTTIEAAAGKVGITWGVCHFKQMSYCPGFNATNVPKNHNQPPEPVWHYPIQYLNLFTEENPYKGSDIDLFTVVRNPYDRMISEYYYKQMLMLVEYNVTEVNDPCSMRDWLEWKLEPLLNATVHDREVFFSDSGHFIPQVSYVYKTDGEIIVKHVLKYEELKTEFPTLMRRYGLDDIELSSRSNKRHLDATLTINDLSKTAMEMIEHLFAMDFNKFGYKMLSHTKPDDLPLDEECPNLFENASADDRDEEEK